MRFFYLLFLSSLLSISINAQITITPGGTATSIINTLVSNGIVVTNPIINCGSDSYGSYSGNLQAGGLGLSNGGIVLTTGSAAAADGPNNSMGDITAYAVVGYDYADPQLTTQPGAGTPPPQLDNCRLEFDMTPICSSFNIAFVFGSEEYPEWVTGAYNDGFGIFVSGPNPLGGNYTNYNMARLPNGQLVSIDNVNSNFNSGYFNTNNTGVMQYDGYTDGLTAQLSVIPCSTYHIKIIIADAGDEFFDSGLFLGAGSFSCSMPALAITSSPPTICAGSSTTLTASTAASGGTYLWSPGGATTQSITVNPSTTTTYTCSYTFSSCSVITANATVTVSPIITPTFTPIGPYCSGATIPAFSTSSTNGISGTWSPAINNTATTTYTFTPSVGQCALTQTRTVTITPNTIPLFTQLGPFCSGTTISVLPTSSINGISGAWSPAINNTATTTYTFTPTAGLCATTQTMNIAINQSTTPTFTQVGPFCSGATISQLPISSTNGISGTWSPAINNTATTTYTFTPTAGICATTQTMIIAINQPILPNFTQVGPFCSGATISPLPTSSINGISGTWAPAINNLATTTYTFTPTAGICATTQTMSITISPNILPSFSQVGPYCPGTTIPPLPTSSTNGISGTWSPAINNTVTTTYTFTPTAGLCATTQTMSISISLPVLPSFTQVGPFCIGNTISALPTSSTNGISGTWAPAINNTVTTTYTFTPTAGLCAITQTMSIVINQSTTPTFTQVGPFCSAATISPLPISSTNGISGTWSPAINNTATTTYTFTPTAGLCATTQTMSIAITLSILPTFTQVGPFCSGATISPLPTSSINGISGTWTPAINNTATTTYTFTPTTVLCATTQTMIITITPNIIPTFTQVGPFCLGTTIPPLPTSSTNGISGTWSPAINNTATTTYTFTPTAGICATTQTMSISINLPTLPSFTQVGPFCIGNTISALPTSSTNGISGTWAPAINNTVTTTYTFTPTAGLCATTQTMNIVISQNTTPTFSQVGPFCSGVTIPPLPTNSINGVAGTWSPAINNTATTTYTYTPTAGLCATTQTMSITITPNSVPLFTQVGPFCSGATISPLPTSSTNGISGTWSPAINNVATSTYTFSPTLITGECASTQTMSIIISPIITSTRSEVVCVSELPFLWNGISYNGAGIYSYYTVTAGGCDSTAILNLSISPIPLTSFIPSISLFTESPQLVAFTNTSVGAATYSWDFGDGAFSSEDNPEHLYAENSNGQTITLVAVSSEGCIGTYQVSIEFEEGLIFYIPNTFTPDGDGHNQTFKPVFTSGFDPYNYEMLIYNRWGEIIFETHDVTYGWDGTYAQANYTCQDGVYLYTIIFKNPLVDERKVVCGSVTLLK
jgi:gliding motility-associated-like protein